MLQRLFGAALVLQRQSEHILRLERVVVLRSQLPEAGPQRLPRQRLRLGESPLVIAQHRQLMGDACPSGVVGIERPARELVGPHQLRLGLVVRTERAVGRPDRLADHDLHGRVVAELGLDPRHAEVERLAHGQPLAALARVRRGQDRA